MVKKYIPEKGDLVWVSFDPTEGHKQKGVRPALVISSKDFNRLYGMAYLCPITSVKRNFDSHIKLEVLTISGFIMVEQLRSVDWKSRKIKFAEKASKDIIESVINCTEAIID